MEWSKIPILSRFDTISHIMPYYARTHKAFLLLSSLCSASRNKLDEFYNEFISHMKENWTYFEVDSVSCLHFLFLPNDLFEVSIYLKCKESINALIKLCENIRDFKGWYFNKNYMHSAIKIRNLIRIDIGIINLINAHVELFKSTKVILCNRNTYTSKIQFQQTTLDTELSHI